MTPQLRALLDESLPAGLDIVDAVEARPPGSPTGSRRPCGSCGSRRAARGRRSARSTAFKAADAVEVQRQTKNGVRTFDARAAVLA